MKQTTYNKLRKVAFDIFGAGAPQGAVYSQKVAEVRPRNYDKVQDTKLPAFGDTREVGKTVRDVLNGNIAAVEEWAKYGSAFKHQPWYAFQRDFAPRLPKQFQRGWVCLQGQSLCMPGQPFYVPAKGRHATTSELNRALNENTKIPLNDGWNLFTLNPELEHALDYNLPGALHLSQWGEGLSGHAIMNAGNNSIYEFGEPGLVKRTAWAPRNSDGSGDIYAPWFRHTDDELYSRGFPQGASANTRTLIPLPGRIAPTDAVGQFYAAFSTHPSVKGQDILSAEEYAQLFSELNKGRAEGAAYRLPGILRNAKVVRSANARYNSPEMQAKRRQAQEEQRVREMLNMRRMWEM